MYCLPLCMYVIGAPVVPDGSSVSQTMLPVALSYARNFFPHPQETCGVPMTADRSRSTWSLHPVALAALLVATGVAFLPVLRNGFVNWDDPAVIVNNQELGRPHAGGWAFTTTLIGHYQPLAWLAWSAVKSLFGLTPVPFHAVSLLVHLLNAVLVYMVAWRLTSLTMVGSRDRLLAAVMASVVFAVHPVRVEAVAWASAFPYVLSLALLLIAFLAYLESAIRNQSAIRNPQSAIWFVLSIFSYAASLLARASAIGFPFVLLIVDIYPLRRARTAPGRLLLEKLPFLAAAAAAVVVESQAREVSSLQEVPLGARITMAATAPFVYLARTVWPVRLTPLGPLPIAPVVEWIPMVLALTAVVAVTIVVWKLRRQSPALGVAWTAYVLLLAPVAGLTPSGLQATADRYMYVPGVIVSILLGAVAARARVSKWVGGVVAVLALVATATLVSLTWRQTKWWRDSITLWTRASDLDSRNDVATYNLAIALADAGREADVMTRYEQTLRLVPDHTLARHELTALQAKQADHEADRLAEAGHFDEANEQYVRTLALDSTRLHARAAHGMVLLRLGRTMEAAAGLRIGYGAGGPGGAAGHAVGL